MPLVEGSALVCESMEDLGAGAQLWQVYDHRGVLNGRMGQVIGDFTCLIGLVSWKYLEMTGRRPPFGVLLDTCEDQKSVDGLVEQGLIPGGPFV